MNFWITPIFGQLFIICYLFGQDKCSSNYQSGKKSPTKSVKLSRQMWMSDDVNQQCSANMCKYHDGRGEKLRKPQPQASSAMTPPRWPTKWSHGTGLPRWYDTSVFHSISRTRMVDFTCPCGFSVSLPAPSTFCFLKLNLSLLEHVWTCCMFIACLSSSTFKPSPRTVSWYKYIMTMRLTVQRNANPNISHFTLPQWLLIFSMQPVLFCPSFHWTHPNMQNNYTKNPTEGCGKNQSNCLSSVQPETLWVYTTPPYGFVWKSCTPTPNG